MIKKLFFTGLLIYFTVSTFAQTDFRPGYVIDLKGDTIIGMIDYRGDVLMGNRCKFKNNNGEIIVYSPYDIESFKFNEGKFYISKEIGVHKAFLEFLVKGKLNIYYMRDKEGEHYYIDKIGEPINEISYEEGIKYIDNKEYAYTSTKHIGVLKYYVDDSPELHEQISNIDKPDHRSLISLAEKYHNIVCDDEKCIVYERQIPFLRVLPEGTAGFSFLPLSEDNQNAMIANTGITAHIWMPRNNEKMYFKTGLHFVFMVDNSESAIMMIKIPLQLEYIYPRGSIRPFLAYGTSYSYPNLPTIATSLGVNIKASDFFYLNLSSNIDAIPLLFFIPGEVYAYSFNVGLLFKL